MITVDSILDFIFIKIKNCLLSKLINDTIVSYKASIYEKLLLFEV